MSDREQQNRRTVERIYLEVLNEGRLELFDELACPDHVEHFPFPGQAQGVEGLKQRVSMLRAAFDPRFAIEHLLVDGDRVAVMWNTAGTHVGEWMGVPPTMKPVRVRGADVHLLRDGRLAEHWDVVDISSFLMQMGAAPAPTGTP